MNQEMSPCPIEAISSPITISDDDSSPDLDESKPENSLSIHAVCRESSILISLRLPCTRPTSEYG